MMELMSKQSREMAHNTLKKKLPEITQKDLDRLNELNDQIFKQFDFDAMIDDIVPVYQRHLTTEDVAAVEDFYETPAGQKFLRERPAMTAEAMEAVRPRIEKTTNSIIDQAEKIAKEGSPSPKPATADKN